MRPSPRRYGSRSPMLTVERGIDGDAQTKKTRTLRMNLVAEVKEDDNDKGDLHSDKEQEEAGTLKPPSLEIRTASPSPASSSRPTTPVDQEGRPSPVASSTSSPDRPLSVQRRAKYMRKPEGPMPLDPWCKHCPPVTADSWLPLKPDEVALVSETRDAMSRVQERPSRQAQPSKKMNGLSRAPTEGLGQAVLHNIQKPTSKIRAVFGDKQPRIQQFHFRMQQTAISCDIAPLVVKNMEEIELRPPMIRSRFSHELYGGPDVTVHWDVNQPKGQAPAASPSRGRGRLMRQDAACLNAGAAAVADTTPAPPVLRRLTTFQVSMLERFALNHVKQQLITASAIANAKNPTNARRANNTFKFGSIMQLLKGRKEGRNTDQENYFLLTRLQQVPLLCDIPKDLFEPVVDTLDAASFVSGSRLFRQGEDANSIFIAIQGEILITSDGTDSWAADTQKDAPCVILPEDYFNKAVEKSRPFLPKQADVRLRSRTAMAAMGEEGLQIVSKHYRSLEAKDRWQLVGVFFAKTQRISPQVCAKYEDEFEVDTYEKGHVFFQDGTTPNLDAKLYLIVEGQIQIVHPGKRKAGLVYRRGRSHKETAGRGKFIGDAALFGEAYPHSAVATTQVKAVTIRASVYLSMLNRTSIFERGPGYEPPELPDSDDDDLGARKKLVKEVIERTNRKTRMAYDMKSVRDSEWKRLLSRTEMPKRVPPGGILTDRAAAQSTEAELMAAARFELGLEEDTTRSRWMPSPSVSEDLRLSRTSGPLGHLGMGLEMSSLDAKIRAANKSLDRVEVEHRSHVAYGYHIEDVAGNPAPASTVLAASPGSSVLMACGQLGLPSLHRQLAAKDPSTATPCEVGGEQQ
eukprot:TRINITY_DN9687_c0_g1_i4.p1 TRINITY_DN9687_c0_g1~~TRINITY_DN9687_c0_g1_i4.p1  ORF type:complete len:856 (-),score=154.89 TRINITY_DN9687_c0_g1_i4:85-2652(-)